LKHAIDAAGCSDAFLRNAAALSQFARDVSPATVGAAQRTAAAGIAPAANEALIEAWFRSVNAF
jgi:hypothetical protein